MCKICTVQARNIVLKIALSWMQKNIFGGLDIRSYFAQAEICLPDPDPIWPRILITPYKMCFK